VLRSRQSALEDGFQQRKLNCKYGEFGALFIVTSSNQRLQQCIYINLDTDSIKMALHVLNAKESRWRSTNPEALDAILLAAPKAGNDVQ